MRNYIQNIDKQQLEKDIDKAHSLVYTSVAAVNNTAYLALDDAYRLLKDSAYFKQGIKHNANLAMKAYKDYESRIRYHFDEDRQQIWLDLQCGVEDEIRHDVSVLVLCIKQVLDRHNETDSDIKAQVIAANTLTDFAVTIFDNFFDDVRKRIGVDLRSMHTEMHITDVQHYWHNVTDLMPCSGTKDVIKLEDDKDCLAAFHIINIKLTSERLINRASKVAVNYNKQFFTDEEIKEAEETVKRYG